MIVLGEDVRDYEAIDSIHYKVGPITMQEHMDYRLSGHKEQ